jgi:hypothetical protein
MSEGFFSRWSRRKRETAPARTKREELPSPGGAEDAARSVEADRKDGSAAAAQSGQSSEAAVDLSRLPPIETIGPDTDIRAFLLPGVPPALTRAALRRAWAADPAIRDFVGLAENSWDFNATAAVPGFGPLLNEERQRLLSRLELHSPPPASAADSNHNSLPQESSNATPNSTRLTADHHAVNESGGDKPAEDAASQHDHSDASGEEKSGERKHGGALPV